MGDKKEDKKSRYNGHISYCMRHGDGSYDYPGANYRYEGGWEYGVKNSKVGKFSLPGLFTYEGEFVDGEITGQGTKRWSDGRSYTGQWHLGEMHGFGRWQNSTGTEVYEGVYDNNKKHGDGILTIKGDVYKGKFGNNIFDGHGTYLKERKYVLDIDFIKGIGQGSGSITWNKTAYFEGNWKDGLPFEKGYFKVADGSYSYIGTISQCCPDVVSSSIKLDIDPNKNRREAPPSAIVVPGVAPGKKGGGAKDDPANQPLSVFTQGEWLGNVAVYTELPPPPQTEETTTTAGGGHSTPSLSNKTASAAYTLTTPRELKRQLFVSICPINLAEDTLGEPIPLWQLKGKMNDHALDWCRFPGNSLRIIDGKSLLTGDELISMIENAATGTAEGSSDAGTSVSGTTGSSVVKSTGGVLTDEFAMSAYHLCSTSSSISAISTKFVPSVQLTRGAADELSFVVDFRLDIWTILKQLKYYVKPRGRELNRRGSMRSRRSAGDDSGESTPPPSRSKTGNKAPGKKGSSLMNGDDASQESGGSSLGTGSPSRKMTKGNSRMSFVIQEDPAEIIPTTVEITVMDLASTGEIEGADDMRFGLQLVLILVSTDPALTALHEKVAEITDNKISIEKRRLAEIAAKQEEERLVVEIIEQRRLAAEAAKLAAEEEEDEKPKAKGKKGNPVEEETPPEEPVNVHVEPTEPLVDPISPAEISLFNGTVVWELRKTQPTDGTLESDWPIADESSTTVISRWTDNNFNSVTWHSLSLTLRNLYSLPKEEDEVIYSTELFVDGHSKLRQNTTEEKGPAAEAVVNAEVTKMDDVGNAVEPESRSNADVTIAEWLHDFVEPEQPVEQAAEPENPPAVSASVPTSAVQSLVVTSDNTVIPLKELKVVIGGGNFSGFVKLFALYNRLVF